MGQQRFGANSHCRHAGRAPGSRRDRQRTRRVRLIEPIQRKVYDLAGPVKRITHENLRDQADFVGPVGTEGIKARTGQINQDLLFKLSNSDFGGQAYGIGILRG